MRIAIIGCGNMGGAIARGLAADKEFSSHNTITVANRSQEKLTRIQAEFPDLSTTTSNVTAAGDADIVILAVKPWHIETVAAEIKPVLTARTVIVSVAANIFTDALAAIFTFPEGHCPVFYVIPNTAASIAESMTAIAEKGATEAQRNFIVDMFNRLGSAMILEERLMPAAMILGSCGTAFAMRYVRAAMEAGVELGLYPAQARHIVAQTLKGAAELLLSGTSHPEEEVDKVTTPGGITIKGLNRMEACGFSHAVIEGHKACR